MSKGHGTERSIAMDQRSQPVGGIELSPDTSRHQLFISTLPPTATERRLAVTVVVVSCAVFLLSVPFAKVPLTPLPVFVAIYQSILVVSDLITAVLLFGNASILRSRPLMILASGYLFTGAMAIAHMLTFPGLFAPAGLLGAGPQSTAWLYMFWHAGFPLTVMAYFRFDGATTQRPPWQAILACVLLVLALAAGLVLLTNENASALPSIMRGSHYTGVMIFVVGSVWGLIFIAAAWSWRRRRRSVLDLWMMVVMFAWLFDVALSAVLNAGRFDVGFYLGRLSGLLASVVVLVVLLNHTLTLYSELASTATALELSNQELDAFAYAVSHDLRAPLRAMEGFSQALVEDYGTTLAGEAREFLDEIIGASRKMAELIDAILTLSRTTRCEVACEPVDISAMAGRLLASLARTEPQRPVTTEVEPGLVVMGDPRMLETAMTNLLGNAWKYGGNTSFLEIRVYSERRDGQRWICIADNGAGFDMKHAARLFRPFQRLHRQDEFPGTGIGLATVQRVIRRHGGDIEARGEPGRGATFCFTLPMTA